MFRVPFSRYRKFAIESTFDFGFVVYAVEANDTLEEDVQLRVRGRVLSHFEERLEYVADHLLEVVDRFGRLIERIETWNLNQPPDIVGEQLVVHNPGSELVPFARITAINTDAPLNLSSLTYGDAMMLT